VLLGDLFVNTFFLPETNERKWRMLPCLLEPLCVKTHTHRQKTNKYFRFISFLEVLCVLQVERGRKKELLFFFFCFPGTCFGLGGCCLAGWLAGQYITRGWL
jgi:hypothetical protein